MRIALEGQELVDHLNRGDDHSSRRRAIGSARRVERLAASLADELSRGGRGSSNGR